MDRAGASAFSLDSFAVGDFVTFERRWSADDFAAFSRLSGDTNPLHHDLAYASRSGFPRPIVPLHVTLSPLSMIAGTVFPGEPSLYLGHQVRAAVPVSYDETLRYSARISAINASHGVLTIRVLALRGSDIVLDATMQVQSRSQQWQSPPALPIQHGARPSLALITGGTGEIGMAIAVSLAKQGWRLLIQDRGDEGRRDHLQRQLASTRTPISFISADLAGEAGRRAVAAAGAAHSGLGLIVHAASPPVHAAVEQLVAVNFSALKDIVDGSLAALLLRQKAAVLLIGTSATEYALPGWEAYGAAKRMSAQYIDDLERRYARFGLRGLTLMPGLVMTRFSSAFRKDSPALLPAEVAEAVVELVASESDDNVALIEVGSVRRGRNGIIPSGGGAASTGGDPSPVTARTLDAPVRAVTARTPAVASIVRKCLGLHPEADLAHAGMGSTPGWDSLKHIELLLALEAQLGIRFTSSEIDETRRFSRLEALCLRTTAGHAITNPGG